LGGTTYLEEGKFLIEMSVIYSIFFSYIADTSSPRSRTWRLGCAEAFWQLGSPIGLTLGAVLFRKGGYLCVFATSALCHLVAVLYTAFLLPEVPKPKPAQFTVGKHGWYGTWDNSFEAESSAKRTRYYSETHRHEAVFSSDGDSPNNNSNDENSLLVPNETFKNYAAAEQGNELISEEAVSVKQFVIGAVHAIFKKRPNHTRKCLLSLGFIMLLVGLVYHGIIIFQSSQKCKFN